MFPALVRKAFQNIALIIISVIIGILFLEITVRAFHLVPVNDYRKLVEEGVTTRFKPFSFLEIHEPEYRIPININNAGFRDNKDFIQEKKTNHLKMKAQNQGKN